MIPTEQKASSLVEGNVTIQSLPTVYTRLDQAIANSRTPLAEIAEIISQDSGLSSRLLGLVNSSIYGFPSRVDTVSRAVVIVGTHQLRDLALATSVVSLFKGIPGDLVDMESFWRHSVACGVAARIIAGIKNAPNTERFFVGGVLHDIGRLVLFTRAPEEARESFAVRDREGRTLHEAEVAVLGCDHADVGQELVRRWRLPVLLEELVGFHHRPEEAIRYPLETAVLHISDVIANALQLGSSGEKYVPALSAIAWKTVGLGPHMLESILEQVEEQYTSVVTNIL